MDTVLCAAVAFFMTLLFAGAAWHKLSDLAAFERVLLGYRLLPAAVCRWLARLVPGLELGAAGLALASLWLPSLRAPAALACALLLGTYAGAMGINLLRGRRDIDCGCGGPGERPLSWSLVVRNLVLIALVVPWLSSGAAARPDPAQLALAGVGAASVWLLFSAWEALMAVRAEVADL